MFRSLLFGSSSDASRLPSSLLPGLAASLVLLGQLAVGLAPSPASAQSPTAVTSIVNGAQDTTLKISHSGGLVAPGKLENPLRYSAPNDSILAEGAGTRMMWYPEKAAFRAGQVSDFSSTKVLWNAANVGMHSVAFGRNTEASSDNAIAMGEQTTASGENAMAVGNLTTASGEDATAMGSGTTASGRDATAMGSQTTASATYTTAMGFETTANAAYATAMGNGTTASERAAVAMGFQTTAGARDATAMGSETTASGSYATAMGRLSTASGGSATAMGAGATASGRVGATAMGLGTTASGVGATAMGQSTTAGGEGATAMGTRTTAATENSLTIGECNGANTSEDNTLFVAGNGTFAENLGGCFPSNALVLDDSGNLTISGSLTENSDRRLKTGIEPLGEYILEKLSKLRPVRYRFKNQETRPSGEQIGLIAQDVRKEFPSLVTEGAGGYLSLAYPKLTAVLLKGLQEQQATIDSLEKRTRRLDEVEKRLAALEAGRFPSALTGQAGSRGGLLLAFLLGGLLGAGLLWRRRG